MDSSKEKKRHAKDENCVECGKQADVFFPVFDPDINPHAYCQKCVDETITKILVEIYG